MLKKNCRYFMGDKPCDYHKAEGIKCNNCNYYLPLNFKILIIKLDAIGDVLRTTSILPPLKRKFSDSYITWCTRTNAKDLIISNDFVDEVIFVEEDAYFRIMSEQFDLVINLDTSKFSSAIATTTDSTSKEGFILNRKGFVEATSEEAQKWLEMSAFDDVKRQNQRTYQQVMYDILKLKENVSRPVLKITGEAESEISSKLRDWKYRKDLLTIGLNIGVGTKWISKGWPIKNWEALINHLRSDEYNLLLLGGPEEKNEMTKLKNNFNFLIDTGFDNSLMEFAAIVDLCDVIVTADTLALHIATALQKKIIALFGPTSLNEIELFGKGNKLTASEECSCYYSRYCTQEISCMEKITSEMVYNSLNSLIDGKK